MKTNIKKKLFGTRNRTIITLFIALVLLAVASLVVYRQFIYAPPTPTTTDGEPVNLEPATEEDKKSNDQAKDNAIRQTERDKQSTNSSGRSNANVVIVNADANGVRAYVSNIFEEGGTCTFTATADSKTVTKTTAGFQNVSYTQCNPVNWDTPLGVGNWSLTVEYSSPSAQGSQTRTVEVK